MSDPDLEERGAARSVFARIDQLETAISGLQSAFATVLAEMEQTKTTQRMRGAPSLIENLKHAFEALRDASKADKVTAFMKRDALHLDAQMTLRNVLISLGVTPEELQ